MEKHFMNHNRIAGLLLLAVGFLILLFLTPFAAASGLLASLFLVWSFISLVGLALALILHLRLKQYVKSLLTALAFLIPWSTIFFIPLPDSSQLLLALVVALIGVLIYQNYSKKSLRNKRGDGFVNKPTGAFLILFACVILYFLYTFMLIYGLFVVWLASLPLFLVIFIGLVAFLKTEVKKAIESWLAFVFLTLLPWITVLSGIYQILSVILVAIVAVLGLYWYRRRYRVIRSHRGSN